MNGLTRFLLWCLIGCFCLLFLSIVFDTRQDQRSTDALLLNTQVTANVVDVTANVVDVTTNVAKEQVNLAEAVNKLAESNNKRFDSIDERFDSIESTIEKIMYGQIISAAQQ